MATWDSGPVTNSILFFWLFTHKDQFNKSVFTNTQSRFASVVWISAPKHNKSDSVLVSLKFQGTHEAMLRPLEGRHVSSKNPSRLRDKGVAG